jgi:hypothetical protein
MDLSNPEKQAFRTAYDFFNRYSHMTLDAGTFGKAADEMALTISTSTDTPLTKQLMFAVYETLGEISKERTAGHENAGASAQDG